MGQGVAHRRTALVTGASAGIGLELARCFAAGGYDLVLTARNGEALQALAGEIRSTHRVSVRVIVEDLADPAGPQRLVEAIEAADIRVDALVNNAGFGGHGLFINQTTKTSLDMIQVNVSALTELSRRLLPQMVHRRHGRVLNVASIAGYLPGPHAAVYYATKAYVVSLSEALSLEHRGTGVTVTALCPGPTVTEFQKRAGFEKSRLFDFGAMSAASVALAGYRGCVRGRRLVIPGFGNKCSVLLGKLLPGWLTGRLSGWLNRDR